MNKLLDLLQDFAHNLQSISVKSIEELEIILPYENYKQLEYEISENTGWQKYSFTYNPYEVNKKIKLQTTSGIKFNLSCKEINDAQLESKLKECFKILSK